MRFSTKENQAFLAIGFAILLIRLAFAFAFPIAQMSDYSSYFEDAQRFAGLKDGNVDSWNPIGPKLLYALPLRLFGPDVRVVGVTNAFVFLAGVVFLYLGARRAFDRSTAILASLISLLSLSDLYFNNLACTEVLAGFFLNLVFYQLTRPPSTKGLLALGAILGLATYNRSNMIVMGGAVLIVEWLRTRKLGVAVLRTAVVQGTALLVLLPLCRYNASHFGRFTAVTSNSGIQIWYGNNPDAGPGSHSYAGLPEQFPPGSKERIELANAYRRFFPEAGAGPQLKGAAPYDMSDLGVRYTQGWIRQNPGRYATLSLARLRQMYEQCSYGVASYLFYDPSLPGQPKWSEVFRAALLGKKAPTRKPDGPPNPRTPVMRFVASWYQVLLAGAAIGFIVTLAHAGVTRVGASRLLPGLIVAIYTVPFVLTIALNRYHVPVMGLLWTYLAHGLVRATYLWRMSGPPAGPVPSPA